MILRCWAEGWTDPHGVSLDWISATCRHLPMLTERFLRPPARARAPISSYWKDDVMKRLLEFLNAEAW